MSSESRIKFNNKAFWMHQIFIEVLSYYLCKSFENIGLINFSEDLQTLYMNCEGNKEGTSIGMANIPIHRCLLTESDRSVFLNLLDQTKNLIAAEGNEISISKLDAIENSKVDDYFKNNWEIPIKTQSFLTVIDMIKQLILGTWEYDNYAIYFKGYPQPATGYVEV